MVEYAIDQRIDGAVLISTRNLHYKYCFAQSMPDMQPAGRVASRGDRLGNIQAIGSSRAIVGVELCCDDTS